MSLPTFMCNNGYNGYITHHEKNKLSGKNFEFYV